jgi:hypothetical protein
MQILRIQNFRNETHPNEHLVTLGEASDEVLEEASKEASEEASKEGSKEA